MGDELRRHLSERFTETDRVQRRTVKEKLYLTPGELDAMNFRAVWRGQWRKSVGYWTCSVDDAVAAGMRKWTTLANFRAEQQRRAPPTPEEVQAKIDKKKESLKRKIDSAFRKAGKQPLGDIDAYSDLNHATIEVKHYIRDRRRVLEKKADRCEERYGDRRLAYDSAGDTSDSCYYDYDEQNVVDAYLHGHRNLQYTSMDKIADYLANPPPGAAHRTRRRDDDRDALPNPLPIPLLRDFP